jgi:hypothetical protein
MPARLWRDFLMGWLKPAPNLFWDLLIRTPHLAGQANLKIIEVLLDFRYMVELIKEVKQLRP